MGNHLKQFLVLSVLVMASNYGSADTLRLPEGSLSAEMQGLDVPKRGMSKEQVEEKFGAPISKSPAIGDPPISSWKYDKYTVYFESDKVLHAVANLPANE